MELNHIPADIKEKLLAIANRLPREAAPGFLREAVTRLHRIFMRYPRTISYSVAGYLLGAIIDNIPVVRFFTGGMAKYVGLALGAGAGLARDAESARRIDVIERETLRAIQEALEIALNERRYAPGGAR